jgi:hypothetical protein
VLTPLLTELSKSLFGALCLCDSRPLTESLREHTRWRTLVSYWAWILTASVSIGGALRASGQYWPAAGCFVIAGAAAISKSIQVAFDAKADKLSHRIIYAVFGSLVAICVSGAVIWGVYPAERAAVEQVRTTQLEAPPVKAQAPEDGVQQPAPPEVALPGPSAVETPPITQASEPPAPSVPQPVKPQQPLAVSPSVPEPRPKPKAPVEPNLSIDTSCPSIGSGPWNDMYREFLQVRLPSLKNTFDQLVPRTVAAAQVDDVAEYRVRQESLYQVWRNWNAESRRWVERAFGLPGRVDFEAARPSDALISEMPSETRERILPNIIEELRLATGRMECLRAIEQSLKVRAPSQ